MTRTRTRTGATDEAEKTLDDDDEDYDDEEGEDDDESERADGVDTVRPLAMDKPVAGHPDDLTVTGGIGPKIQVS
ncbi:MAG: hypothetical protein R3C04_00420 [Hyphomonas sp.]